MQNTEGLHKLSSPWEGPFTIAKVTGPGSYRLGLVDMLIRSLILCLFTKREQTNFMFALTLEILIKLLLKINIMSIADFLVNAASGHIILSLLDGNASYNQIFMAKDDTSKTTFICLGFVALFEWIVMTFGLKNVGATYQKAMNLIFHGLVGIIVEVYIDDIVVKSAGLNSHLVDLRLAFETMCRYGLQMNPLKCAFAVSAGKFLGFTVHEKVWILILKRLSQLKRFKLLLIKKSCIDSLAMLIICGDSFATCAKGKCFYSFISVEKWS
jgi:hypothetical protein